MHRTRVGEVSCRIIGGRHSVDLVEKKGTMPRKREYAKDPESEHGTGRRGGWGWDERDNLSPGFPPGTPGRNENPPPTFRLGKNAKLGDI